MIKLKRNFKLKILSLFALATACVGLFACNSITYAYTMDSSGNLVSDNCADYASISSNAFLDLGSGRFVLNWNGAVQTVSIPTSLSSNTTSGSYTLSCTLENGVGYAFYQWFFMYSDNTSERITSNQGLTVGQRYEFTSNSSKILTGLQVVCNNNSIYDDLMLNPGEYALSYEVYGSTYYSHTSLSNFSPFSVENLRDLYVTSTFRDISHSTDINGTFEFVHNGELGYSFALNSNNPNSYFNEYNYYYNSVNSSYGVFYNTTLDTYNYIRDISADSDLLNYPLVFNANDSATFTYIFITPFKFDGYLINGGFNQLTFYNREGLVLYSYQNNDSPSEFIDLNVDNVYRIVAYFNDNDLNGTSLLGYNPYTTGFNDGYNNGYSEGYNNGYTTGSSNGYDSGYRQGYYDGGDYADTHVNTHSASYQAGLNASPGFTAGYSAGYAKGVTESSHITDTTTQGKELIWTVASTPWESFKNIWNVNIFGLNIANIITGIVTALLVIYLIKKVWK